MRKIERVMAVMTHAAIGAALGMVGWLAWAGVQVVSGEWKIPRAAQVVRQAGAATAAPVPQPGCCAVPADERLVTPALPLPRVVATGETS